MRVHFVFYAASPAHARARAHTHARIAHPPPLMTNTAFRADVAEFCRRLRRRQVDGAGPCARGTAELLRRLIAGGRHPDPGSLLEDVRAWGVAMQAAHPMGEF